MAKGKTKLQLVGFDELANEELSSKTIDEVSLSKQQEGEDETMAKGTGKTEHNLVDMGAELTVEVEGISELFNTVEEDGSEDKEIIEQLSPKDKKEKGDEKPEGDIELTLEGKVHEYRANFLAQAFPEIAQELADKHKAGKTLPGRKKIKKKVIGRAAEIAMEDPKIAQTVNESGGIKVFIEELEETFNYPPILARYEKLIEHLILESARIAMKQTADKPKDEPVAESVGEEAEEPLILFAKPKNTEKPKDKPKEVTSEEADKTDEAKDEAPEAEETITSIINKKFTEDERLVKVLSVYTEVYPDLVELLQDEENVAEITMSIVKKRFEKLAEERVELKELLKDEKNLIKLVTENDLYTIDFGSILHDVMKEMLPPSALKVAKKYEPNPTLIFNMFKTA